MRELPIAGPALVVKPNPTRPLDQRGQGGYFRYQNISRIGELLKCALSWREIGLHEFSSWRSIAMPTDPGSDQATISLPA